MKRFKNLKRLLYSTMLASLIILGSVNVFAIGENEASGEGVGGGSSDGKPLEQVFYILIDENDVRFEID